MKIAPTIVSGAARLSPRCTARPIALGEQTRGTAQPRAHEILMRRDADHAREQPQEMKSAQTGGRGYPCEVDRFVRMRVDPLSGIGGAAPVAGRARLEARRSVG